MADLPPVVIIAGPTASGKSALALEAAERFDGEVINADSMQVYRELSVLTARPTPADHARVPHHLYGVLPAATPCSAGLWLEMVVPVLEEVHQRGKLPVVCGGTGLYIKVLMEGIADIPDVPAEHVADAERLYEALGGIAFVDMLSERDPVSAARLLPSDRQRLIRAYAVVSATGTALPQWHKNQSTKPPLEAKFLQIQIMPDRAALYGKIEKRFDAMMEDGALDEVKTLMALELDPALPAMKALGVPELMSHLKNECDLDDALDHAKQMTRNLAKRQMTWFRNQSTPDCVLGGFGSGHLDEGAQTISQFLARP